MDQVKIGAYLRQRRKELRLTQKDIARQLYISEQAVSKWENGHSFPDKEFLQPLADILDTSVLNILNGGENHDAEVKSYTESSLKTSPLESETETGKFTTRVVRKYVAVALVILCIAILGIMLRNQQIAKSNIAQCYSDSHAVVCNALTDAYSTFEMDSSLENFLELEDCTKSGSSLLYKLHQCIDDSSIRPKSYGRKLLHSVSEAEEIIRKMSSMLTFATQDEKGNIVIETSDIIENGEPCYSELLDQLLNQFSSIDNLM